MPCPLSPNVGNTTSNVSLVEIDKEAGLQAKTEAGAFCTPSYFMLNTQVAAGQGRGSRPGESVGPVRGAACPDTESVFPQTAYTIPIMAFAFVCHPEVLPIYTELKE